MALKLHSYKISSNSKNFSQDDIMDNPKLQVVSESTFSLPIPPSYVSASAAFRRELTNSFSKAIASLHCTAKDELTL